jgi:hypothetical protein
VRRGAEWEWRPRAPQRNRKKPTEPAALSYFIHLAQPSAKADVASSPVPLRSAQSAVIRGRVQHVVPRLIDTRQAQSRAASR